MKKRSKKEALAILLILLAGVFAYNHSKKSDGPLSLPAVSQDGLKDAVANKAARAKGLIEASADLTLPDARDGQLKDSVAQSPAFEAPPPEPPPPPPAPPRGFSDGGINPGNPNPQSQIHNNNAPGGVSVSGPQSSPE